MLNKTNIQLKGRELAHVFNRHLKAVRNTNLHKGNNWQSITKFRKVWKKIKIYLSGQFPIIVKNNCKNFRKQLILPGFGGQRKLTISLRT